MSASPQGPILEEIGRARTSARLAAALERIADLLAARSDALCIDGPELARRLRISERHLRRLDDQGALPQAINFGGSKRWFVAEIEAWLRAGAPSRREWSQMRETALAGVRDHEQLSA